LATFGRVSSAFKMGRVLLKNCKVSFLKISLESKVPEGKQLVSGKNH
jgi:hypothetical protein